MYTPVDKETYTSDGSAFYNGSYVPAYYNSDDHKWYRTRKRRIIPWGYEYSNEVTGDVDGDGDPTIVDATFIMRYCVGIVTPYGIGEPV